MKHPVFGNYGVPVTLSDPKNFLQVCETLRRIGTTYKEAKILYQQCHILHKRDFVDGSSHYAIMHFKEMFAFDGVLVDLLPEDIARRNTIAVLLEDWELVDIVGEAELEPCAPLSMIKIIKYKEVPEWDLRARYTIGKRK